MDIKNELLSYLDKKGLFPECHIDRLMTFKYKERTFCIRPFRDNIRKEAENIISMSLKPEKVSIILYNINSYELPESKRCQMLQVTAVVNLKYRGIKAIVSVDNDYHSEILLESLNNTPKSLMIDLEEYLDNMILASDEISQTLHI